MHVLNRSTFRLMLNQVVKKSEELGVDGVFAVAETVGFKGWEDEIRYSLVRRDNPLDDASDGHKYNLLAIVLAKIAASVSHGKPSGGEVDYEGEVRYRGALLSENGNFIYAFSGGTEDQDVAIAKVAAEFHKTLPY